MLVACGTADNPYSKLPNPPLVSGRLHVITLVSDARAFVDAVSGAGWQAAQLPPNYPQADAVQAGIWGVPEPVAAGALHFRAGKTGSPDLRVLVMPLAAKGRVAEAGTNESFFRNVLGADVPAWPLPGAQPGNVRVQAWTYLVPDIVDAAKKLRGAGIPVIYDPVGITTAYMGDHRTMAIRAPDGTVVQLVQGLTQ
jgi:hypothetical protein